MSTVLVSLLHLSGIRWLPVCWISPLCLSLKLSSRLFGCDRRFHKSRWTMFACMMMMIMIILIIIMCSFLCYFSFGAQGPLHEKQTNNKQKQPAKPSYTLRQATKSSPPSPLPTYTRARSHTTSRTARKDRFQEMIGRMSGLEYMYVFVYLDAWMVCVTAQSFRP